MSAATNALKEALAEAEQNLKEVTADTRERIAVGKAAQRDLDRASQAVTELQTALAVIEQSERAKHIVHEVSE